MRTSSGGALRAAVTVLVAAAAVLAACAVAACGVCVEDRMAAVYDHAMVSGAHRRGQVVAFVGVEGQRGRAAADDVARARRALAACPGVDPASLRAAPAAAALAFAYDPARVPLDSALARVGRTLAVRALRLETLQVLKVPRRPAADQGRGAHRAPTRPSRSGQVARPTAR